jgi:hypothetical protein
MHTILSFIASRTRTTYYATGSAAPVVSSSPEAIGAVSGGSNHTLTVVVPAVVGTIGGLLLLIVVRARSLAPARQVWRAWYGQGAIVFVRYRTRKQAPSREWTNNPNLSIHQAKGAREMSEADVDDVQRHAFVWGPLPQL